MADSDINPLNAVENLFHYTVQAPVFAFRRFMERQNAKREPVYYYERKWRRVPTVDECLEDDYVCIWEADMQYQRDKQLEGQIIFSLKTAVDNCYWTEGMNAQQYCQKELADFEQAKENFAIKHEGVGRSSFKCLQKQKTRLLRERQQQKEAAEGL